MRITRPSTAHKGCFVYSRHPGDAEAYHDRADRPDSGERETQLGIRPRRPLSDPAFWLAASGVGSWLSPRVIGESQRRIAIASGVVATLIVAERWGLERVFNVALHWDFAARVGVTLALVGVASSLMGMLFPAGLVHAPGGDARGESIARAWVLNGYASVVSSVGSMVIAMAGGFSTLLAFAAALYGVAAVAALRANHVDPSG